jgi:outer membrane biosynthesis protein TonB
MVEAAMKAGASGVIVCGCQIGDCYYREGNKMIRERLLGERPPGLKKTVDRRRVIGLWLSKPQTGRFISEAKEFVAFVGKLNSDEGPAKVEPPKPAPAAKPAAPEPKSESDQSANESAKPTDEADKPQKAKTEAKPAGKPEKSASAAEQPGKQTSKKTDGSAKSEPKEKPAEPAADSKDKE